MAQQPADYFYPIVAEPASAPVATAPPINAFIMDDVSLDTFRICHEINPQYMPLLRQVEKYRSILILDDSGSMQEPADPDVSNTSRWEELKQSTKIVIEAHAVVGSPCDLYFINRGCYRGVTSWSQVDHLFVPPPRGGTNIVKMLREIQNYEVGADMGKPIIFHLFTDGHPTNDSGTEDLAGLHDWIKNRTFKAKTLFSIVLCTDDEEIERMYRRLERSAGVDVSEDFRGESRDVKRMRGARYRFSKGDYIVKIMVGAFDKTIHQIDLEMQCCILC